MLIVRRGIGSLFADKLRPHCFSLASWYQSRCLPCLTKKKAMLEGRNLSRRPRLSLICGLAYLRLEQRHCTQSVCYFEALKLVAQAAKAKLRARRCSTAAHKRPHDFGTRQPGSKQDLAAVAIIVVFRSEPLFHQLCPTLHLYWLPGLNACLSSANQRSPLAVAGGPAKSWKLHL